MRIHGEELEVVRTDGGGVPVLLLVGLAARYASRPQAPPSA